MQCAETSVHTLETGNFSSWGQDSTFPLPLQHPTTKPQVLLGLPLLAPAPRTLVATGGGGLSSVTLCSHEGSWQATGRTGIRHMSSCFLGGEEQGYFPPRDRGQRQIQGSSPPFSISALGSCSLGGHLSTTVWNKRLTKGETDSATQPGSLHLLFALGGANYVACSYCGSLMCFFKCSGNVKS